MYKPSAYTIVSKIKNSEQYYLINLLSKQADILDAKMAEQFLSGALADPAPFIEKGYLVDPAEEKKAFKIAYLDFLERREKEEIQLFFVPGYTCNFSCSYCYQSAYENRPEPVSREVTDAFFTYIANTFRDRKKYITLFGGEPLLPSQQHKEQIAYFLEKANQSHLDIAIVTNGYTLTEYLPLLTKASIREIQVTLDGTRDMHNKRRMLQDKTGTFDRIVQGIDAVLAAGLAVNLRVVVDKENISNLSELAAFASTKGWTEHPLFKTQLGRNYELHTCQKENERLYSRLSLYEELYEIIKQHPDFLSFHKPAFSIAKFLFEQGELPEPLFDSCPGTKTEWAFDYTGIIYSCTATVGKKGEELGTFYPMVTLDAETCRAWQARDILSIEQCKSCNLALACGGGCGSVAKNKNGVLQSPDCRPVKELLSLGMSLYFEEEVRNV